MKINKELNAQILTRNVADIVVRKELEAKLNSGKPLRIKFGIDPTGAYLTLGHMVVIRKLREFQQAGHEIILLFGNFTAQIGDPSGKTQTRVPLTQEKVEENAKNYLEQVGKVLDLEKVKVTWNADWLGKLNFGDILKLSSVFTVSQMLERDMYQERIKKDLPIGLHEFLYPMMQGYDSVALESDVELGGTDQMFNMLAARPLQKSVGQTPQCIMTMKILVGTDGVKKMGKSEGNFIAVLDKPQEMYGKIMSIPDHIILNYFEMCTDCTTAELSDFEQRLKKGDNPRDIKMQLGRMIVEKYHSKTAADEAEAEFIKIFAKGGLPEDIETIIVSEKQASLIDLLVAHKLVASRGEVRRLIEGGGIKINQEKITDQNIVLDVSTEKLVQIGKRKFVKFISN